MDKIETFENFAKSNGDTYSWDAFKLMEFLGYKEFLTFEKIIKKAKMHCLELDIEDETDFRKYEKEGKISYKLSRFACFIITLCADDKKEQVKKAKVYFAKFAAELMNNTNLLERFHERKQLTAGEKAMQQAASEKGLLSNRFGIFKDKGIRGMYNMSLDQLKKKKQLNTRTNSKSATLYDFMNLTEIAANTFRTTQTAERLKRKNNTSEEDIFNTASQVGKEVREIILKGGGEKPEDIPLEDTSTKKTPSIVKRSKKQIDKIDQSKK